MAGVSPAGIPDEAAAAGIAPPVEEGGADGPPVAPDLPQVEFPSPADRGGPESGADDDGLAGSGLPQVARRAPEGADCPNCGEPLEARPKSRMNCPHCGRVIHVRARQGLFRSGLVGEDDVDAVDFLERVEPFGIDERHCRRLMQRASLGQAVWQLCEDRLEMLPPGRQTHLLDEMAEYLRWQGKDAGPLRRRAKSIELLALKSRGVREVLVVTRGEASCAACRELDAVSMSVEHALTEQPVPVPACTRSVCRCTYRPATHAD